MVQSNSCLKEFYLNAGAGVGWKFKDRKKCMARAKWWWGPEVNFFLILSVMPVVIFYR